MWVLATTRFCTVTVSYKLHSDVWECTRQKMKLLIDTVLVTMYRIWLLTHVTKYRNQLYFCGI